MRAEYIGDALDCWKRQVILLGTKAGLTIYILPMITDGGWDKPQSDSYARILGVDTIQLLKMDSIFSNRNRVGYFQDVPSDGDLFIDPDTGIAKNGRGNHAHIRANEVIKLMPDGSDRVLLVYQHSFRKKGWATTSLDAMSDFRGGYGFAFFAGAVSMLVFSRNRERLDSMRTSIVDFLGKWDHDRVLPVEGTRSY